MTPEELVRTAVHIRGALFSVPPEQQLEVLKKELGKVPEPYRAAVEDLVLSVGYQVGKNTAEAKMNKAKQHERWAAYGFGAAFALIMLLVALWVPNPTAFQYFVFRALLAVAAAGVAAFIPGFLEVEISKIVRAGGAIAVFVLVYFFSPAQLLAPEKPEASSMQNEGTPAIPGQ